MHLRSMVAATGGEERPLRVNAIFVPGHPTHLCVSPGTGSKSSSAIKQSISITRKAIPASAGEVGYRPPSLQECVSPIHVQARAHTHSLEENR